MYLIDMGFVMVVMLFDGLFWIVIVVFFGIILLVNGKVIVDFLKVIVSMLFVSSGGILYVIMVVLCDDRLQKFLFIFIMQMFFFICRLFMIGVVEVLLLKINFGLGEYQCIVLLMVGFCFFKVILLMFLQIIIFGFVVMVGLLIFIIIKFFVILQIQLIFQVKKQMLFGVRLRILVLGLFGLIMIILSDFCVIF